jgi:hypothetical protein
VNSETPHEPTPELLAAFADDELDPAAREAVEHWLTHHPDARHEIEAQQQLVRLYQAVSPPEPSESAWASAHGAIRSRTMPVRRHLPRRILRWSIGLAATAALIALIALAVKRLEPAPDIAGPDAPEPPLPVASPNDVMITSLDNADRDVFVVGDLPLPDEPLPLAEHGDVQVVDLKPDAGMNLEFQRGDSTMPMIFASPREAAPDDKKPDVPLPK